MKGENNVVKIRFYFICLKSLNKRQYMESYGAFEATNWAQVKENINIIQTQDNK